MELKEALKLRRSHYALSKESPISQEKIEETIKFSLLHTPTPFNIQNGRVLLLLGDNNQKIWDITEKRLKEITDENGFKEAVKKIDMFRNSYATAVIFYDKNLVEDLQKKFPAYAESFPTWSDHAVGILTGNIWVTLEAEGLGLSLQHYQNLIEEDVKKEFNIPDSWVMTSQMPMGTPTMAPDKKEFSNVEERLIVR